MPESTGRTEQLADYQRRYRELAGQLAEVGFIATGTVVQRSTRCGTPGCRCHADPPQSHGPYWQWTTKVGWYVNRGDHRRRSHPAESGYLVAARI